MRKYSVILLLVLLRHLSAADSCSISGVPATACEDQDIKGNVIFFADPFGECSTGPYTATVTATQNQKDKTVVVGPITISGNTGNGPFSFSAKKFKVTDASKGISKVFVKAKIFMGSTFCCGSEQLEVKIIAKPQIKITQTSGTCTPIGGNELIQLDLSGTNKPEDGQVSFSAIAENEGTPRCPGPLGPPTATDAVAASGTWAASPAVSVLGVGQCIGCKFKVTAVFTPSGAFTDQCSASASKSITTK